MKKRLLLREKIKLFVAVHMALAVILEGVFAYLIYGFENDENKVLALKLAMLMLSTVFIVGIGLLFSEFLAVSEDNLIKYNFFIKKQQMQWKDVKDIEVGDKAETRGMSTRVFKCIVIRGLDNSIITFSYDEKTLSTLRKYYENAKAN